MTLAEKPKQSIKAVQNKILEIMKYIDAICRRHGIVYFIMGGTALGAIRHKGFIPWDDDLDIFMTPENYERFHQVFHNDQDARFVLQEWRTVPEYLEYAKVRMNGTTFIEANFKDKPNMHHGIYVDIMILHKAPTSRILQRIMYVQSKFVTLYGLSQRNWKPKTRMQSVVLQMSKLLPRKSLAKWCYRNIYRYDKMSKNYVWCYFITPARFHQGIFEASMFEEKMDVPFEDIFLFGSSRITEYLGKRYGNYMELPLEEKRTIAIHAEYYDTEQDYTSYFTAAKECN